MAKYEPPKHLFSEEQSYEAFVEKFKPKKTTDDCYTPAPIYDATLAWARKLPRFPKDANVLRPFKPGGDYQGETYEDNDVVVDNPPFSILSQIVDFYCAHDIPFFLYAPNLTLFGLSKDREGVTAIACSADITYANGAVVRTGFITNMHDPTIRVCLAPDLNKELSAISRKIARQGKREVKKKVYPDNVVSSALLGKVVERGVDFVIRSYDCRFIRKLDNQRENGIFGGGYLLSDKAAAERAAAERAAAERAAAERFNLSEREKSIIAALGNHNH